MGKIIDEWGDWSLKRHSEDEIRDKVLSDYNNICFSYVCEKKSDDKAVCRRICGIKHRKTSR